MRGIQRMNGTWSAVKRKFNKKIWVLGGVALLLVGAVIANFWIGALEKDREATPVSGGSEAALSAGANRNFFESFRQDRDTTREKEIQYIDTIITQGADAETLADAQKQKLSIVENMEKELTVESLLKAKGFSDAAVTLHAGSVNVILSAEQLTDEEAAQVLDIVLRETGETAENVKVTTAN